MNAPHRLVTTIFALTWFAAGAEAQPIRSIAHCLIVSKFQCDAEGCRPIQPTIQHFVDLQSGTMSRCDANGCDKHPVDMMRSGAFMNISIPGRGTIAKLSDLGDFMEVATLGNTALISFGRCSGF